MASTSTYIFQVPCTVCLSATTAQEITGSFRQCYEANRHRIYSLSFWMTGNELWAEQVTARAFSRAFRRSRRPSAAVVDQALIQELARLMPLGLLSLQCSPAAAVPPIRRNALRVHLEQAVLQLPHAERLVFLLHDLEGYEHGRISEYLGLSEASSRNALLQARLRIRELLAELG
jgi:RNA polymerase sigma-70 factor (ECF subfamily)